jgi:hypothetical protein
VKSASHGKGLTPEPGVNMAEATRGISEPELQFIPKIVCLDISRHAELIPMIADRCLNRGATDLRPLRTRRSTGSELRKIYEFHNQSLFIVRYVATCLMNLGPTFEDESCHPVIHSSDPFA